jgi:hypothetical protein
MSTCKDCLHYEVCGGFTPTDLDADVFDYCRKGNTDEIPDIDERCGSFKPKADYAPVVRCKDCNWYQMLHSGVKPHMQCCNLQGLCRICKPTEFCSYGERKESEVQGE